MSNLPRVLLAAGAMSLAGCGAGQPGPGTPTPLDAADTTSGALTATAIVRSASGATVGTVMIAERAGTLDVSGLLRGLSPGVHAIHLHTTGACSAPTFESAGAHWNPTMRLHGSKNEQGPHLGDLPNITVAADSSVRISLQVQSAGLRGTNGLLDRDGAAVVVHADPDDERTDPTGNAGDRLACGVVTSGS